MTEDVFGIDLPHNPILLDWSEVVREPAFWSYRYDGLPGISDEQDEAFFLRIMGYEEDPDLDEEDSDLDEEASNDLDEDDADLVEDVPERVEGSMLDIPFPEGFTWRIAFYPGGIGHTILHPEIYPGGVTLANESGSSFLPGLRWPELLKIARCLKSNWHGTFDIHAIIPLLFPVVQYVTFDEVEEAGQMLLTELQALKLIDAPSLGPWLDQMIKVYDYGESFIYDPASGWQPELRGEKGVAALWVYSTDQGWHTPAIRSYRQYNSDRFAAFFAMLDRCSPSAS